LLYSLKEIDSVTIITISLYLRLISIYLPKTLCSQRNFPCSCAPHAISKTFLRVSARILIVQLTQYIPSINLFTRKLIDEYELWGLKLNVKKQKYTSIGDTLRDLQLEDGKGIKCHVNEYTYLGVRITKDENYEPEINDGINRGRAAVTKLNNILWDRDVTPKQRLIFIMQYLKVQLHMQQKHGV